MTPQNLAQEVTNPQDSLFNHIVDVYRPTDDQLVVPLPRGELLYFNPLNDPKVTERIKVRAQEDIAMVRRRACPPDWLPYALQVPAASIVFARFLYETMDCAYASSTRKEITETTVLEDLVPSDMYTPEGEKLPKWTMAQWVKLSAVAPGVFTTIWSSLEGIQTAIMGKAISERLEHLGESSPETP